ncbi:MAG: aconitate hydratase [Bacillota bacterium]|nr:aconitate hydratase [Bacillota bacterium]MDW7677686.1 aconitate hydratase [Bacillota bacterium]
MKGTLTEKIISRALLSGDPVTDTSLRVRVHQTLTQDSTGTVVYLQMEAMGIDRVKTEKSVAYIDHNTLQTGPENAEDHRFIQSAAARYGITFSKAGNGICHQLHLENFAVPGKILMGSDSHTPTCGGLGMLAVGAGGLDVAEAMAFGAIDLTVPRVIGIRLTGSRKPWVAAKDVILAVLKELTVSGGIGSVLEYSGAGVATLSVTERAAIANMGAEAGATSSVFPSDDNTRLYLKAQQREQDYLALAAEPDACYDRELTIDLDTLEPMIAHPHSPDRVTTVTAAGPLPVQQILIGSCTNASYHDLMKTAAILKDRQVHPGVNLAISPGSASILEMMSRNGALADMIRAGARILECACGPCIGMGQSPAGGSVSLRTFNRNFKGRSGTSDAAVYLCSPETAAVSALTGKLTDPAVFLENLVVPDDTDKYVISRHLFAIPAAPSSTPPALVKGSNIREVPLNAPPENQWRGEVVMKAGDHVTTDDIMPSDASLLPFRSNIPHLSAYCFEALDKDFVRRCRETANGLIVAGRNYGQGSSREHAALVPLYLGVKAVMAQSFARIHRSNLINSGILPLTFLHPEDMASLALSTKVHFLNVREALETGTPIQAQADGREAPILLRFDGSEQEVAWLLAGGKLNWIKENMKGEVS